MKKFRLKLLLLAGVVMAVIILITVLVNKADNIDQWPDKVKLDTTTTVTR